MDWWERSKAKSRFKIADSIRKKRIKYSKVKNAMQGVRDYEKIKQDNRGCQAGCTEKDLAWAYQNKWYCSKCMDIERKSWYKDNT
jgi:ribosomal protein S27AE